MRPSSLGYLLKQGWKNMAANRLMTFASIGVLTACLIITGIAALLSLNVNQIMDYLGDQNVVHVYLLDETSEEQAAELEQTIAAMPNVLNYTFVSKEAALDRMREWLDDYSDLLEGYPNVLPASFDVTVDDLELMRETSDQLAALPGVEEIQSPTELAGVMVTVKNAVNIGGWALVAILALVSIIVISNTIRLTVFARRREISIMKYVGATNAFIRLPFFVEGMTVGALAGLLGSGAVCGAYYLVMQYINESNNLWIASLVGSLLRLEDIWLYVVAGFVIFGVLIGSIGTTSSIRKHLKV